MAMRVIEWPAFIGNSVSTHAEESAMTVGVFDGVHLGHRKLIENIVRRGPNPTVVTFRENPKKVISPDTYEGDIFSLKQKLAAFESLGVRRVVLIDFSENFSKINGWEFLNILIERGRMFFLTVGVNFRCGFRQDTGAGAIKEMNERKGIPTELIPPVEAEGVPVSSSRIRRAIISGELALAAALTGRAIQLDLSGVEPLETVRQSRKCLVYDLRSVCRIVPEAGHYSVTAYPGAVRCEMDAEKGKVFLPQRAERLEFS